MPYWTPGSTGALPLTRTLGDWSLSLLILHEEMQDLDQKTAAAVNRNGDTVSGNFTWSGTHGFGTITVSTISGAVSTSGAWTNSGAWSFSNSVSCSSTVNLLGRTRISGTTDLSDANHTLYDSVTSGLNQIRMLTAPAANRVLTLPEPAAWAATTGYTNAVSVVKNGGNVYTCTQTGTSAGSGGPTGTGTGITDGTCKWDYQGLAPIAGDWFEVLVLLGASAFTVGLQRAGSADYVAVLGDGVGAAGNNAASAKVRFDGTHWHLLAVGGKFSFHAGDS